MSNLKVHFRLEQDEDGYPPVAVESVWAQPGLSPGEYVIDNVPFFVNEATIGDTVSAQEEDGAHWFRSLISRSRNSLIRIVFFDKSRVEATSEHLVAMGCSTEYLREYSLMAVSIPAEVALTGVQAYLQSEAGSGSIDYEESILRQ